MGLKVDWTGLNLAGLQARLKVDPSRHPSNFTFVALTLHDEDDRSGAQMFCQIAVTTTI